MFRKSDLSFLKHGFLKAGLYCTCKNGSISKSEHRVIETHWVEYFPHAGLMSIRKHTLSYSVARTEYHPCEDMLLRLESNK